MHSVILAHWFPSSTAHFCHLLFLCRQERPVACEQRWQEWNYWPFKKQNKQANKSGQRTWTSVMKQETPIFANIWKNKLNKGNMQSKSFFHHYKTKCLWNVECYEDVMKWTLSQNCLLRKGPWGLKGTAFLEAIKVIFKKSKKDTWHVSYLFGLQYKEALAKWRTYYCTSCILKP